MVSIVRFFLVSLGIIALASCDAPTAPDIKIEGLYIRQGHAADVAYFSVRNLGQTDDRLLAITSTGYKRVEMHSTDMQDGIMKMRRIEGFDLAAGTSYQFSPKGYHIMLWEKDEAVDVPDFSFEFEKSPTMTVRAENQEHGTTGH